MMFSMSGIEMWERVQLWSEVILVDNIIKEVIKEDQKQSPIRGWMKRWTKTVLLKRDAYGFLRVTHLLDFHTLQWGNMSRGSELRFHKETICIAVVEYCTIYKYQLALLSDANRGAAHIHAVLESVISPMLGR